MEKHPNRSDTDTDTSGTMSVKPKRVRRKTTMVSQGDNGSLGLKTALSPSLTTRKDSSTIDMMEAERHMSPGPQPYVFAQPDLGSE